MNKNFQAVNCKQCGVIVWEGISFVGFFKRLDKNQLTIEEELVKVLSGIKTYECHRTQVSFEAVERNWMRMSAPRKKHIIILADHSCSSYRLFDTEVPNYWASPERMANEVSNMQPPF